LVVRLRRAKLNNYKRLSRLGNRIFTFYFITKRQNEAIPQIINHQSSILIMARKTKKNVRSTKMVIIWFIIMAVFIAELLIYTWSRVQCINTGYEISNENNKNRNLVKLQNNLKVELARLKSPERLAKIAKNQLGLKTPGPEQMIIIP